jgi:hypothetical protein
MADDDIPNLIEVRFTFEAPIDKRESRRTLFYIRCSQDGPIIRRTIDIGGTTGTETVEGLPPEFLDQVRDALAGVKKIKLPEMKEQVG